MKDIILATLFGSISLSIRAPDAEGKRTGVIDWSELYNPTEDSDRERDDAIEIIESLILSHACAGVDVESDAYLEGINMTLEAIDNHS